MGRREKLKSKIDKEEESVEEEGNSFSFVVESSGDDEEGNEDLSLKIAEKARLQATKASQNVAVPTGNDSGVVSVGGNELNSSSSQEGGSVVIDPTGSSVKTKAKKKLKKKIKKRKIDKEDVLEPEIVNARKEEENVAIENIAAVESNPVEQPDNLVLRKLLRGPRYFDPPDSSWGTCYNCGEEGHQTINCTAGKRKKPCFVCGSMDHSFKQCTEGRNCFICKKGGHRSKDCPAKHKTDSQSPKICLKCGDSGHEMFSCRDEFYAQEDLKEIQCYVCRSFGHLCCANSSFVGPREVSCYKCGKLGHVGLACARLCEETIGAASPGPCYNCGEEGHFARECTSSAKTYRRSYSDTVDAGTLSSCYKCGEEGHFARECTSKVGKRNRGRSTSRYKESNCMGFMSDPRDLLKYSKNKKFKDNENDFTTPHKLKRRGRWITDEMEDSPFPPKKAKVDSWRSPSTSSDKKYRIHGYNNNSHIRFYKESPMSYSEYANTFQNQKASRFGYSNGDGRLRNSYWENW